jgi:protease-4
MFRRARARAPYSTPIHRLPLTGLIACAVFAMPLATGAIAGAVPAAGLPDTPRETMFLVDTPGTSASVAAGLFNPAAWGIQRGGGFFFSWDDARGDLARDDYAGVVSVQHVAFGVRQFQFEPVAGDPFHVRDYTLGTAFGNRTSSLGLAYAWGDGDLDRMARHERLLLGSVTRCRYASLGLAWTHDLEVSGDALQTDLGFRPLGPRLTLFGDAVLRDDQRFADIESGYGVEAKLYPGLALAAKRRSTGEISLRLDVAFTANSEFSFRPHLNDSGDRVASTYAVELGPDHGFLSQEMLRHKPSAIAELPLRGPLPYQRYRFFDQRPTLLGTLTRIQAIADDPAARGVVLNLSGAQLGPEMAWEIREQLAALRATGKRVVVYIDRGALFTYMLATVADQVWMDPVGELDLRGLATGRTFMRHALDKLGLGVDEWRFFTYKSAFESYSRDSMSDPDREQRQTMIDDFYATAVAAILTSRGISGTTWDSIVNEMGVLLPQDALEAGLVDSLGSFESAVKSAKKVSACTQPTGSSATLAGVTGNPTWGPEEWGEPARIAVLYAIGECDMDTGIRGRTLAKALAAARKDRHVKAVVLRADSPGGDPLPSDLVAREMAAIAKKKPMIVSQGQVAASGGYWISMNADTIVASPLTITASIGVIGGWVWNKGFGAKIGLTYDGVKQGKAADMELGIRLPVLGAVIPERNLTTEERARMERLIRTTYADFVAKVATQRGLDEKSVDSIAQGRVWSGQRGLEKKLVDEMGGLWRSLQIAKAAAGMPADRVVELCEGPAISPVDLSMLRPQLIQSWAGRILGARPEATPAAAVDPVDALLADASTPLGAAAATLSAAERKFLVQLLRHNGQPLLLMEPIEIHDGSSAQ